MKRTLCLILAALMLASLATLSAPFPAAQAAEGPKPAIIHQVYAAGSPMDGSISHSFIELFNPSGSDMSLDGYSVQVANSLGSGQGTGPWSVLPLTGQTVKAKSSFLIVCTKYVNTGASVAPRYVISDCDMEWDQEISNRAFSVALVASVQVPLSTVIAESEKASVIELLGAVNDPSNGDIAANHTGSPLVGVSKQRAARRLLATYLGGEDNNADYEILDYRATGISDARLAEVQPRWSGDGPWGASLVIPEYVPEDQKLAFSREAGLYASEFSLTLTTGYTNGTIRYTTDGSDPAPSSQAYTAPLTIAERTGDPNDLSAITNIYHDGNYTAPRSNVFKGNVIKAQVFSAGGAPLTGIYTKSYIINSQYGDLPIMSVTLNKDALFDTGTGLFMNTVQNGTRNYDQRGAKWERPCHVEFFEPDGTLGVSQYMGVRIHGGWSRRFPQKSMRFYARADYDPGKAAVEYDLFGGAALALDGSPITSFKRFIARNSGNDNNGSYIRDALVHRYSQGLNFAVQDSRPAIVLLNGEFWGFYELRERIDEHFVNSKYSLGSTDAMVFSFGNSEVPEDYPDPEMEADYKLYREMYDWFERNPDLSSAELYAKAQTFLDIHNVIDYFIVESYANNRDWPSNNNELWRFQTAGYPETGSALTAKDGRWRYILKDLDQTFSLYNRSATENPFPRLFATTAAADDTFAQPWATLFFRRLFTNPEFAETFVNRYCDLMNTHMKPSVVDALITELSGEIAGVVSKQHARWGILGNWNTELKRVRDFNNVRQGSIISQMTRQSQFRLSGATSVTLTVRTDTGKGHVRVNEIDIVAATPGVTDPARWSGNYFTGKTQTVTAIPAAGFVFEKFIVGTEEYTQNPLSITLTGAAAVQAVFAAEPDEGAVYTDIPDDWSKEAIIFIGERGYAVGITGDKFEPSKPLTRGEFTATLMNAYEVKLDPTATDNFADVDANAPYAAHLATGKKLGIIAGVGGDNYAPERTITRQEMFALLYNILVALDKAPPPSADGKALSDFTDAAEVSVYLEDAIKSLLEAGMMAGSDGKLLPQTAADRAQMAGMIYNLLTR